MDNKRSHVPKVAVNLKQLPPIDPFRIINSSSKGKLNNSSTRAAAAKVEKPRPDQQMKLLDCVKNPTLGNDDASSIPPNKNNDTPCTDEHVMKKGSARSKLYEICAANHWKPPVFECYKEEGPCHQRMFTFKVIIEIEEALENIIECYGAPHQKKKAAADHAAEGALWYLKHIGCVVKNKK